jgi:exosortase/archaeosortase family protein
LLIFPLVALAIFANFIRILVLIALTHAFGDAVAQGWLHETAGFATFAVAMLGVVGGETLVARVALQRPRRRDVAHG